MVKKKVLEKHTCKCENINWTHVYGFTRFLVLSPSWPWIKDKNLRQTQRTWKKYVHLFTISYKSEHSKKKKLYSSTFIWSHKSKGTLHYEKPLFSHANEMLYICKVSFFHPRIFSIIIYQQLKTIRWKNNYENNYFTLKTSNAQDKQKSAKTASLA